MLVRRVDLADASAILSIYAPVVAGTVISFEEEVPTVREIERRIADAAAAYPWLVAERDGTILGYANAGAHRTRSAYRTSVDVAVYVADGARGQGVGRALYAALLPAIADAGYHAAFAGITLPNAASVALHEAFGFTSIGIYREVGCKFGRWLDVGWWQLLL